MKKYFSLILCLCLLVSLVACSKNTDTTPDEGKNDPTNPSVDNTPTDPTQDPVDPPAAKKDQLVSQTILDCNGTVMMDAHYYYDSDENLKQFTQTISGTTQSYTVECDENGNPVKYISDNNTVTFEYNEQGLLIKQADSATSITHTYDDNGNLLRIVYVMLGGGADITTDFIWEDGVKVKTESSSNGVKTYTLYTYDEKGREIRTEQYDAEDNLQTYSVTRYEEAEFGYSKITESFNADGSLSTTNISEYDLVK